ncbi:MAG: sodium/proline symporter [Eubacterium sp.]|jgi:sodium/proline symporter|nr:sodium/proline symporter [Eubacterium sp.]
MGQMLAFILYFIVILGIGIYFFFRTKGGGEKEYFLGGRKMNSWVTAISAQASDMSGWLLMGLPGSILAIGMGEVWIAVGLLIGTTLNWIFTAPRLRKFSKAAGDSITVPEYLSNRFLTKSPVLRAVSGFVFLACFTVYTASSFKACGKLFTTVFQLGDITMTIANKLYIIDPTSVMMLIAAGIIFAYTLLGGYAAVCWTDLIQGLLMLAALMIVPILALFALESGQVAEVPAVVENYWNFLPSGKLDWESISTILSGLAWGLGYFGMPHILVRFMSAKSIDAIKKSTRIALIWVVLALGAAVAVGLIGRKFLPGLGADESETVFIRMSSALLPSFLAGLAMSGILAASMSTADSQLLVSSSAFTSDIYKPIFRKKAGDQEMMMVGRLLVLVITIIAIVIAINPNSGNIMDLVENAWAGFGSAFGAVIILSLCWKRFNYVGAVAGIVAGTATDVVWLIFLTKSTGVYELLPGFIISLISALACTLLTKPPSEEVKALFDRAISTTD